LKNQWRAFLNAAAPQAFRHREHEQRQQQKREAEQ
jgi:hypothetical protein